MNSIFKDECGRCIHIIDTKKIFNLKGQKGILFRHRFCGYIGIPAAVSPSAISGESGPVAVVGGKEIIMNKVHKVIWNRVKHCYVVVSEIAKNHGKDSQKSGALLRGAVLGALLAGAFAMPAFGPASDALAAGDYGMAEKYQYAAFQWYKGDPERTQEVKGTDNKTYTYNLQTVTINGKEAKFWVRDGYAISTKADAPRYEADGNPAITDRIIVNKTNPGASSEGLISATAIGSSKVGNTIIGVDLNHTSADSFVGAVNSHNMASSTDSNTFIKVGEKWTNVHGQFDKYFKEVKYVATQGGYTFNGQLVSIEDIYAIKDAKTGDMKIGVFTTGDGKTLYTGSVYGKNNEILVTGVDKDGKYYSIWAADTTDPNLPLSLTVGQFDKAMKGLEEYSDRQHGDVVKNIEVTPATGDNANGGTISLNRLGYTDAAGEYHGGKVDGSLTITADGGTGGNDTAVHISNTNADNQTITMNLPTGSKVEANKSDITTQGNPLKNLTINGNTYGITDFRLVNGTATVTQGVTGYTVGADGTVTLNVQNGSDSTGAEKVVIGNIASKDDFDRTVKYDWKNETTKEVDKGTVTLEGDVRKNSYNQDINYGTAVKNVNDISFNMPNVNSSGSRTNRSLADSGVLPGINNNQVLFNGYNNNGNISLGSSAEIKKGNRGAIAIGGTIGGHNAENFNTEGVVIGIKASIGTTDSLGQDVYTAASGTVVGANSHIIDSSFGTTLGAHAEIKSNANSSVAIGYGAKIEKNSLNSVVIGAEASANSTQYDDSDYSGSTVVGKSASSTAQGGTILGYYASATEKGGVALGSKSEADRAAGTYGDDMKNAYLGAGKSGATWVSGSGAVSVGTSTSTRQIINVAAGSQDTDAVNVAQLKALEKSLGNGTDYRLVNGTEELAGNKTGYKVGKDGTVSLTVKDPDGKDKSETVNIGGIAVVYDDNGNLISTNSSGTNDKSGHSIALGNKSYAANPDSTAIGYNAWSGKKGIAIGSNANGANNGNAREGAITIGVDAATMGLYSTLMGTGSVISSDGTHYLNTLNVQGAASTVVGAMNKVTNGDKRVYAGVANSISGAANTVTNSNGVTIQGTGNTVTNAYNDMKINPLTDGLAFMTGDYSSLAKKDSGAVAVIGGANTISDTTYTTQIGFGNTVKNSKDVFSSGSRNTLTHVTNSVVLGNDVEMKDVDGVISFGNGNGVTANNAVAIGQGSEVSEAGGVALGEGSVADRAAGAENAYGKTDTDTGAAWVSGKSAVSVGTTDDTRQITNVAAGSADTDAVNVAQLKKVQNDINSNAYKGWKIAVDQPNGTTVTENIKSDGTLKVTSKNSNLLAGLTTESDGTVKLDVSLNDRVVLGNESDTNHIRLNGPAGRAYIGGVMIGQQSGGGANPDAGKYVTGLDNTKWDAEKIASGRAATEDQLKEVWNKATEAVGEAGKHTVVTVNDGTAAGEDKYSEGGNLLLKKTTDDNGKATYDVKLADKVTLGTDTEKSVTIDGTEGVISIKDLKLGLQDYTYGIGDYQVTDKGGYFLTGLTNTTFKLDSGAYHSYEGSSRAATEGQLYDAFSFLNTKIDGISIKGDGNVVVDPDGKGNSGTGEGGTTTPGTGTTTDPATSPSWNIGLNNEKITLGDDKNSVVIEGTKGNVTTTGTVSAGGTSISSDGLKVGEKTYVSSTGLNANDQKVINVADGEISATSKDAVNGSQLYATNVQVENNTQNINILNGSIRNLDNRVNRVGAGAAALAALHPLDFDPDAKWDFSAGYGNYNGANAVSVGAFYRPNEDLMFSVGGSMGGGENMVNAGVSVKLGSGSSHVTTSKVAMAKEIKDLRQTVETQAQQIAELAAMVRELTGKGTATPAEGMFPDVPENHWAYEAVKDLKDRGYVTGYPDGTFKGDRTMTRYEFAQLVHNALQAGAPDSEAVKKLKAEFAPELERFTVDTVAKDKDGNPTIQRVRVVKKVNG